MEINKEDYVDAVVIGREIVSLPIGVKDIGGGYVGITFSPDFSGIDMSKTILVIKWEIE